MFAESYSEIQLFREKIKMILVNLQLTIKPEVREEFIEWFYSVCRIPGHMRAAPNSTHVAGR